MNQNIKTTAISLVVGGICAGCAAIFGPDWGAAGDAAIGALISIIAKHFLHTDTGAALTSSTPIA